MAMNLTALLREEGVPVSPRTGILLLSAVIVAAVAFRLWLIAATDFPINDGALFYEFLRETSASFPGLPERVVYNGFSLPFAYPPLSFWIGASLTKVGFDALSVIHILPILMNIFYVLLIGLLLLKAGRSPLFTALTLLFFCFRLRSFEWLVMGGGLSRGLGSIFLVAALLAVNVPGPGRKLELPYWRMALGGAFVAGAILSHLEWGILAAASLLASRALGARSIKEFVLQSMVAGATALALVLPWFLLVLQIHGFEPFLAASGTSSWNVLTSILGLLELLRPAIANPFILLGGLVLLVRRDPFWFAFALICLFLTPRHAPTPLALPLSIFAAQGVLTAWGMMQRFIRPRRVAVAALVSTVALIVTLNTYRQYQGTDRPFRPVPSELRAAMAWIGEHHKGAKFIMLNRAPWYYDGSAEWFPTLAQARSMTTVQGREWLPNQAFERAKTLESELEQSQSCTDVLERLRPLERSDFIWAERMQNCFETRAFAPIYRNRHVTIFRVNFAPLGQA
jgi:hypothetical protein